MVLAMAALVALGARRLPPRGTARPVLACAAMLLAFAAIGVRVPGSGSGAEVLLVDVSWSTGVDRPGVADLARRAGFDAGRARVVLFGAAPVEAPRGVALDDAILRAGHSGSDLPAALRAAEELAGPGGRIAVATDGRIFVEAVAAEAARLLASGTSLTLLPIGVPREEDARILDLSMAGRAPEGSSLPVGVSLGGAPGEEFTVRVEVDGRVAEERIARVPPSGRSAVRFLLPPLSPGWHEVTVALRGAAGAPENDRASAGVVVSGPPRVLAVNDAGLGKRLEGLGYEVVPGDADARLSGYDLVLLRDTPATAMRDGGAALREFVRGGGGLLLIAGGTSFGPGGYGGRPIEECLPLRSDPGREGTLVIVLLDCSGTMGERFADNAEVKLAAARGAASRLLAALPDDAAFLLVPFSAVPLPASEPVLLSSPGGRGRAAAAIAAAAEARGGTALAPPLLLASEESARAEGRRLVLLVTDGRLEEEAPEPVRSAAAAVRRAGARLTVLAVGEDADIRFLEEIAGSADRVVRVESGGGLERAFLEAFLAAEGEGRILAGPRVVRRGPGRGPEVPGGLPAVSGLVRTWPQGGPEILYETEDGVPIVALGRFGLGRAAAVTTDPCGDWAPGFLPTALVGLLADVVRRPAALGGPRAEARPVNDGTVEVRAWLRMADAELRGVLTASNGRTFPVVLRAAGEGIFSACLRAVEPGAARLTIEAGESTFDGGLGVPGPAEFLSSGPDENGLARLREAFGRPVTPVPPFRDVSAAFAAVGLLFLLLDRVLALKPPPAARR